MRCRRRRGLGWRRGWCHRSGVGDLRYSLLGWRRRTPRDAVDAGFDLPRRDWQEVDITAVEIGEQLRLIEEGPIRRQLVNFLLFGHRLAADIVELIIEPLNGLLDDE